MDPDLGIFEGFISVMCEKSRQSAKKRRLVFVAIQFFTARKHEMQLAVTSSNLESIMNSTYKEALQQQLASPAN